MGTISSGVGLISGLDIQGLVSQLIAIEARPKFALINRVQALTVKQTALLSLQARVLSIRLAAVNFGKDAVFQQKSALSSNDDILGVTATRFAVLGNYNFVVKRLASSHQLVSNGFSSSTSRIGSGTLSFEIGQGQLAKPTDLSFINGQQGFKHGTLNITDRAGNSDTIDLTTALTMQDVIDAINASQNIDVTASVSGDHLVIQDNTQQINSNLIINGDSATSLGIDTGLAGIAQDNLIGDNLLSITSDTRLIDLNDANGVRNGLLSDIRFTLKDATSFDVDLVDTLFEVVGDPAQSTKLTALNSGGGVRLGTIQITDQNKRSVQIDLTTLGPDATLAQLRDKIESDATTAGLDISLLFGGEDHIRVTDNSAGADDRKSHFIIEDIDGGFAAADLGIVGDVAGANITGEQIYRMETVGDVINAINNHYQNTGNLIATINDSGTGLKVTDNSTGLGALTIEAINGNHAAEDLGLLNPVTNGQLIGRRLIAGLNTIMLQNLNGGSAADPADRITQGGIILLTDRDGNSAAVDLTSAFTVQDVLDGIKQAATNITVSLNPTGNGIVLKDSSTGSANLTVSGELADKLNLTVNDAISEIDSGNLQLQYVNESTHLDDLRQGRGIRKDEFVIFNGLGQKLTVNLANMDTLQDVIDKIDGKLNLQATINSTGDGLLITDTSGQGQLRIEEIDNGHAAGDLGILGEAKSGQNFIDGSFEYKLEVGGGDNLEDIVSRINNADIGIRASIINDGDNYRLSFNSETSGRDGIIYLDPSTTTLSTTTLSQGHDALLMNNGLLIRSSSNTVENIIKGATLELKIASNQPVDITIEQDVDGIVSQVQNFVDAYNSAMDDMDNLTKFDPDTLNRGILFGESIISNIKRSLQSMVQRAVPGGGRFNQLTQVGIKFIRSATETTTDANGNTISVAIARTPRLEFNEDDFRQAMADDPQAVAELFTKKDVGVGDVFGERLENLAGSTSGIIKNRVDAISSRQDLFNERIERLDDLLDRKEDRLLKKFFAMERALASLQSQQSALLSLSNLTTLFRR